MPHEEALVAMTWSNLSLEEVEVGVGLSSTVIVGTGALLSYN